MQIVISICVVIITVMFILIAIEIIDTLKKLKEAAQNISKLTSDVDELIENAKPAFKGIRFVSDGINTIISNILSKLFKLFNKVE
ncbi:MAG: hypothetical protein N2Z20_05670 [Elusimicrobiales bacterium]|nr:hypothetical protein [Elusimicrobiales bacterium]